MFESMIVVAPLFIKEDKIWLYQSKSVLNIRN